MTGSYLSPLVVSCLDYRQLEALTPRTSLLPNRSAERLLITTEFLPGALDRPLQPRVRQHCYLETGSHNGSRKPPNI